jgi:hypothetical protein
MRLRVHEERLNPPLFPPSCEAEYRAAVKQTRADSDLSIDTDSDLPPMVTPWNAVLGFFGLGAERDATGRALVTFAIPVRALTPDSLADGSFVWPVRFRMAAYRASDGRRVDVDTTRRFATAQRPEDGHISGHFELPLDDGSWQIALLARQRDDTTGGAYALRRSLVVGGAATLQLGDVVTGRAGQPAWRAPDGSFPVNTLGTWLEDGTVDLWFEVRGVPESEEYRTTIEVIPSERRLGDPIRVITTDRSTGQVTRVRKAIGLGRLDAGRYELVVTVEHDDQRATRRQDVLIIEAP